MADLGARVLKIERPGEGDDTRRGYIQLEEAASIKPPTSCASTRARRASAWT